MATAELVLGSGAHTLRRQYRRPFPRSMFHSVELTPGASPYARDDEGVKRILGSLVELFAWCSDHGFQFSSMSEAATLVG